MGSTPETRASVSRSRALVPTRRKKASRLKTALLYANFVIALGLIAGLAGISNRIEVAEDEKLAIESELGETRTQLESVALTHERYLRDLLAQGDEAARRASDERATFDEMLDAMVSRLQTIEAMNRETKVEAASTFRRELDDLRASLRREISARKSAEDVFREFEANHRRGVVLVYAEFDYRRVRDGKLSRPKTVSGWGSGFFITQQGHIVTNKHVVQPWKFDQDIAAMAAMGEIVIDESSLRVAVWESGSGAFDTHGDPNFNSGYNNTTLRNLSVFAVAPDHMNEQKIDSSLDASTFSVHDLDNNDLMILKAAGKSFDALPCADVDAVRDLAKLAPVMALGFPRGQNGLERGLVESSPSVGTVRKVEKTIHVTASIIPGNSGGPLIGPRGEVVGIVTRIYSETLGICIKIEHALDLLDQGRQADQARRLAFETLHRFLFR